MSSSDQEQDGKASSEHGGRVARSSDEEKGLPSKSYLVEWDGDSDPLDPRNFSPWRKWTYVAVVSMGSLLVYASLLLRSLAG
jgi:hypothetical protein